MQRLGFLDMARGVGALMVLLYHFLLIYLSLPNAPHIWVVNYVHFGQAGIVCFFIISGFVISISLERHQTLTSFFIARMWRLLPVYWLILTLGFITVLSGLPVPFFPAVKIPSLGAYWGAYLLNLTTFQEQLGISGMVGMVMVSWTIATEIDFYIVSAFIFWIKPRSLTLPATLSALLLLALFIAGWMFHKRIPVFISCFILMALNGQVIYYAWKDRISRSKAWAITALIWGVCMAALVLRNQVASISDGPPKFMMCSWTLGYLIFGLFLAFPKFEVGILKYIGRISYSFYLLHVSVVYFTVWLFPLSWYALVFCVVVSLLLSKLCYDWVEMPCVRLGNRLMQPKAPQVN